MAHIDMKIRRSPIKTASILDVAWRALQYQWNAECWGNGREKWTPDHTQYMYNVIDEIASLMKTFEDYRSKEILAIATSEIASQAKSFKQESLTSQQLLYRQGK